MAEGQAALRTFRTWTILLKAADFLHRGRRYAQPTFDQAVSPVLRPRNYRLEEETAWLERYRQLWASRFLELDLVLEDLKRKEKVNGRKKRK